jgi:hypothetical protein
MKLKKLCAGAAIAALMTTTPVLARVSKEDAQTYANCEGFDHLVVKYDMYWMDRSEWLSYKEAFLETFTPLEKRKLDKKAKALIRKLDNRMSDLLPKMLVYVPEDHAPQVVYAALVSEVGEKMYHCYYDL